MDKSNHYFKRERKILGELNSAVEEDYTGQQIISMNSHERESYEKFSNENDKLYEVSWKSQFFGSLAFPIVHIFTNISYVAICILGGYFTINGVIVIGNFQAFIQYVNRFNRPITEVAQINATIQQVMAAAERIFEFLDAEEEDISKSGREILPDAVKGDVEFHDVSFGYSAEKQVIKNFSTRIEAGKKVAIVGPTGAGKTTIVNLLMRFYDPNSGYITIDEVPTSELKRSNVRNLFGMVLQDTWLFSGTIRENLRYGSISSGKAATDEQIEAAIAAVGLKHFIESLPDGLDTKISEDSDNVSAGEKQLLTIARAMVADAPMMILDEATSNVDTRTEQLIQKAFNKLTDGRTSFVIAHRLSTIRDADIILVMRDGNIVEQGKHDDLLKLNGFYAELYNSQFAEG
jgi:ATP-binding cassette subfamily B protein